jgi:saccharopine dehydrogenase-like NADP-dependent oxidoreductase
MTQSVLVLGGYGNFGKRIVENLASIPDVTIYIAGRSLSKAKACIDSLQPQAEAKLESFIVDIYTDEFKYRLLKLSPSIVIHTSGPFQGQSYDVPEACIQAGAHYIDLADDRRFVCDIVELDSIAKKKGVLAVSGASSVPGLSSAVITHSKKLFSIINSIDITISPGNKAERGEATLRGILSYTGHPLKVFRNGEWQTVYGWMSSRVLNFGDRVGRRHVANVDVPDLELFPENFSVKNRVTFQAGLELPWMHFTMVCMAFLSKIRFVKDWSVFTKYIYILSEWLKVFGSDRGAMRVVVRGQDDSSKKIIFEWNLYAHNGIGPYIPTLSAIILTRKLLKGDEKNRGAMPCTSLFTVDEFMMLAKELGIYFTEKVRYG